MSIRLGIGEGFRMFLRGIVGIIMGVTVVLKDGAGI